MDKKTKENMKHLKEKCKNCNCTFGSHSASDLSCPATEAGQDFDQGPGTKFEPKDTYEIISNSQNRTNII